MSQPNDRSSWFSPEEFQHLNTPGDLTQPQCFPDASGGEPREGNKDVQVLAFLYAAELLDEEETRQFEDLMAESQTAREFLANAVRCLHFAAESEVKPQANYQEELLLRLRDPLDQHRQQGIETSQAANVNPATYQFESQRPEDESQPTLKADCSKWYRNCRRYIGPIALAVAVLLAVGLSCWTPPNNPTTEPLPAEIPAQPEISQVKKPKVEKQPTTDRLPQEQVAKTKELIPPQQPMSSRPNVEQLGEWLRLPRSQSIYDAHAEESDRRKQLMLERRLRNKGDLTRPSLIYTSDPTDGIN
ncbi:MAG: hypothetical protein ACFCD0_00370 [Gemmataceae bacterium]